MSGWAELLVGGGIGAVVVAAIQAVAARRKLSSEADKAGADATQVLTGVALSLVEPLQKRIHELEEQLDRVTTKATDLERQLDAAHDRESRKDALISELSRATVPGEET